jgi:hypothetical protein
MVHLGTQRHTRTCRLLTSEHSTRLQPVTINMRSIHPHPAVAASYTQVGQFKKCALLTIGTLLYHSAVPQMLQRADGRVNDSDDALLVVCR